MVTESAEIASSYTIRLNIKRSNKGQGTHIDNLEEFSDGRQLSKNVCWNVALSGVFKFSTDNCIALDCDDEGSNKVWRAEAAASELVSRRWQYPLSQWPQKGTGLLVGAANGP